MILRISLSAARGLLLFSLVAAIFLGYYSLRHARATHALSLNTRAGYEQAVRLEPGSAFNWYLLGRFYQNDFEDADPAAALRALLVARKLNPVSADVLLELAANYDDTGKMDEARSAYLEAKRVYPQSAEVLWRYGNFLLRQREIPAAFSEIHTALQLDPRLSAEAFSRSRRMVPNESQILDAVIPRNLGSYIDILRDLTAAGQLDDALLVWSRADTLPGSITLLDVTPLVNALIERGRTAEADRVWRQAAQKTERPLPPDDSGSVVWDGGFESGFRHGGFGWHFDPSAKGVQISLDPQEKHSGVQSLRLVFNDRKNLPFSDVCHWTLVEPGKAYQFSAWIKTRSLTSDEGVRFVLLSNSRGKTSAAYTSEVHGDAPWTKVDLAWTAPPESKLVYLCAARYEGLSSDGTFAGSAWIDDVSLIPAGVKRAKE